MRMQIKRTGAETSEQAFKRPALEDISNKKASQVVRIDKTSKVKLFHAVSMY